jgi:hypothetical protein
LGQKRTIKSLNVMSALPPKADIAERCHHVRFVPKADVAPPIRPVGQHAIEMMRVS